MKYLERERSGEDDRVVRITLTGSGKALQGKARGISGQVEACFGLAEEKRQQLHSLLNELLKSQRRFCMEKGKTDTEGKDL